MASDESVLRMAAIAAVLAVTRQQGPDPAEQARKLGLPWSQDHRRMMTGQASLMRSKSQRSPWR
ncbi:MAG: hypothetical protein L7S56_06445 [Candidatus Poseidonia sp.]|nr:hypothetical protein [Poseidonia sp.]